MLRVAFLLGLFFDYEGGEIYSSETSVYFQRNIHHCTPEDRLFINSSVRTSNPMNSAVESGHK
jgi:hypothetical protein